MVFITVVHNTHGIFLQLYIIHMVFFAAVHNTHGI